MGSKSWAEVNWDSSNKLFWHYSTHAFCKLDHCVNETIIFMCFEKIQLSKQSE